MSPVFTRRTRALMLAATIASLLTLDPSLAAQGFSDGAVYTSTNAVSGNEVAVFARAQDGTASFQQFVSTGGLGTGAGLGNQGAVTLSDDHQFLYVVNAGSNDLSVFRVLEDGLELLEIVPSYGELPVSVDVHDDFVVVLNAGDDRLTGFTKRNDGTLKRSFARKPLSGNGTAAAQVGFSNDGRFVFVTERATNLITRYRVTQAGRLRHPTQQPSEGVTPFGFFVGQRDQLIVSEAAMGDDNASTLSSYQTDAAGGPFSTISAAVPSGETAACWVAGTPDGRLVFVANTGTDSVSSYAVAFDGSLTLLDAQAAATDDRPLDMALTADGLFFYVLNAGVGSIGDYTVGADGSLTGLPGTPGGLPDSASGLAAR